jgi:fructoselysine-6-P-deglycase FrlB-like protein
MTLIAGEILDQPNAWRRAAAVARSTAAALPADERIAVIGCGSSWHAAKVVAALREQAGRGETDAFAASEAQLQRGYDRVVAISRSGATTEIRRALGLVSPGTATVALVGDPLSPVAAVCDHVVDLSFADDRSVVQTRFVTTAVCFARAALGHDMDDLLADARSALSTPHPDAVDHVVVLGRGWRVGLADAGALVLSEAAQLRAEAHPAMEYRHGPMATAGPGTVVWFLDEPPAGLTEEIAATGATVLAATVDPLAELIRIQRFATAIAERRGLDPDRPMNLERAVVLEGGLP